MWVLHHQVLIHQAEILLDLSKSQIGSPIRCTVSCKEMLKDILKIPLYILSKYLFMSKILSYVYYFGEDKKWTKKRGQKIILCQDIYK